MLPKLFAVVVNWNLRDDTLTCVESLVAAGLSRPNIVVVDNASADGSVPALRDRFGAELSLIQNPVNLGFGPGNNVGIHFALDQGAQWIQLINNDAYVAPAFFAELERAVTLGPQFAILGPLIYFHDRPQYIWSLGDRLLPGLLVTYDRYKGKLDQGQLPPLVPVDFVTGCGMLVRSDVFEHIGLFDPALFMYGEDVDFCWRARVNGYRLACATQSRMWHKVSVSSNSNRPAARYWRIRNQLRFYRNHARGLQVPIMMAFTVSRAMRLAFVDLLSGQSGLLRPLLRGWVDGWFNLGDSTWGELDWNR